MHHIKTGLKAREIMDRKFPILDSSLPLIKCVRKMNNQHEACLIISQGNFSGVLGTEDILRGFMYGKDKGAKIQDIEIRKNFATVRPESDIYETLSHMKEDDVDFVVVRDRKNVLGLISRREIADVEPILFEHFEQGF